MTQHTPQSPDDLFTTAIEYARANDKTQALNLFRFIVHESPDNVASWLWIAHLSPEVEEKRAALRQVLYQQDPPPPRVTEMLQKLMTPDHVRHAAHHGVFMSYSRADELFAMSLTENLQANGVSVWLDVKEIHEDTYWHGMVQDALQQCGVMLSLLSPASLYDEDIFNEWETFTAEGKILIPIVCADWHGLINPVWHPPIDFRHDYDHGLYQLLFLLSQEHHAGQS